ncbi:hypothetical protein PVL30_004905 [Lodderomyces elongisporus]|uniref:uncharacterized protein n=1 Tax=Lodderomyces elongisporus TaxID=36914 RepID=UPI00291FBF1D|nr:uncharacterized protein PVL30_004905 [Lodderomyces elongisporus]WLF81108.1 hypothetical protein PVL30_004905 [Lodderomyces elongisporus]
MSAQRRLTKEYIQYKKTSPTSNNPQILSLAPLQDDDLYHWRAVIAKPSKQDSQWYYNGEWTLDITVPPTYPQQPPTIKYITPIIHPNVDLKSGEICLDILKSQWSPAWNLESLVVAILQLMDHPEPDSPLNIDAANLYRADKLGFESLVQFHIWQTCNFYKGDTERFTTTKRGLTKCDKRGFMVTRDVSGVRLVDSTEA